MVAMIMIFMLSILGIASMRGASIEGQLATNAVHKEITFQAAESASDAVLATENALEKQICKTKARVIEKTDLNQNTEQKTSASISYGGRGLALGYSLGGPIGARRFVVTGSSSIEAVNTSSEISQGILLIGAADNSGNC
ncbi:MAG: hypothetical protein CSB44_08775 [Gammaproteobacteria bacterium]|nr:MAG: hypothetical protein CSB44_08775 [Gammaproteobacteria bacterium]PIE37013.1 MAG: hypothetical protein CSA54_02380 [Gammaproteobacteria bacterium]